MSVQMPAVLDVAPIGGMSGHVRVPGSKSLSIRAMLLAALCTEPTLLVGVLDSADTQVMHDALCSLGVSIAVLPEGIRICGVPTHRDQVVDVFVGNSGLSMRTLLPVLAFLPGEYTVHGVPRMHERPAGDLVDALNAVGAQISYLGVAGFLPLRVHGVAHPPINRLIVRGDVSSQFLTGLLQVAVPLSSANAIDIAVEGVLISRPYVALTLSLMAHFGVVVDGLPIASNAQFRIPKDSVYRSPGRFEIEGDASSASYFLALGALTGGPVVIDGIGSATTQGDIRMAAFLQRIGASVQTDDESITVSSAGVRSGFRLHAFDEDFNEMPDAAMTAAVVALFTDGPCRLRNIGSWRVKETDRIDAMARELVKCGAKVSSGPDWLQIDPPMTVTGATIDTYDDHRIAMCFALAASAGVTMSIRDPQCVNKTYPDYFLALDALRPHAGA